MKNNNNDPLKQLLQQKAATPTRNKWFTSNVLHMLPERRSRKLGATDAVYALAAMACIVCWCKVAIEASTTAVTVRTLVEAISIVGISGMVIAHYVKDALRV